MTLAAAPAPGEPGAPTPIDARRRRRRPSRRELALVGLVVVVSAVIRLEGIPTWYWVDEALSVGIARHNAYEIPSLLLRDGSPPLWYLLLNGWTALFGTSAVATHALSLVFALLTVPAAWFLGRRLFSVRAGWLAAVLAATNPFLTYFARETRMYSLVVLLALVVAASFVAAFVDGDRRASWWFGGSLLALLYTHNWGLYTAVACGAALVAVALLSDERSTVLRRGAVVLGVVGVAYLPWVPALLSQVTNTGAPWSFTPTLRGVIGEVAAVFRDERVLAIMALGAGVGVAPLVRERRSREARAVIALTVIVVVPLGIGWVLAHIEPSWATRYLAVAVGPVLLLVALGLARAGTVGIAALVLGSVLVLQPVTRINGLPLPRDAKSNARSVAEQLAPRLAPGDTVLVAQPEAVPLFRTVFGPGLVYADPTGVVEDPTVMDWRDAEDRLRGIGAREIEALLEDVGTGERIAIVTPGNRRSSTDTEWIELFRRAGRSAVNAVRADDRFELVGRVHGPRHSFVTFNAVLWERVAG